MNGTVAPHETMGPRPGGQSATQSPFSNGTENSFLKRMNSVKMKLSFSEMSIGPTGSVMTRAQKMELRSRNGYCLTCEGIPVELYTIKKNTFNPLWKSKVPRDMFGECAEGVCYKCYPERNPHRRKTRILGSGNRGPASLPAIDESSRSRATCNLDASCKRLSNRNLDASLNSSGRPTEATIDVTSTLYSGSATDSFSSSTAGMLSNASVVEHSTPLPPLPSSTPAPSSRPSLHVEDLALGPANMSGETTLPPLPSSTPVPISQIPDLQRQSTRSYSRRQRSASGLPTGIYIPDTSESDSLNMSDHVRLEHTTLESSDSLVVSVDPEQIMLRSQRRLDLSSAQESNHVSQPPKQSSQRSLYTSTDQGSTSQLSDVSSTYSVLPVTLDPAKPLMEESAREELDISEEKDMEKELETKTAVDVPAITAEIDSLLGDIIQSGSLDIAAEIIMSAMRDHANTAGIQAHCLCIVWDLCKQYPANNSSMVQAGIAELIVETLKNHTGDVEVQEKGCGAIWSLGHAESNRVPIIRAGGCQQIVTALKNFIDFEDLARNAVGALRSLSPEFEARESFVSLRASKVTAEAMGAHRSCTPLQRDGCAFMSNCAVNIEKETVTAVPPAELDSVVQAIAHHLTDVSVIKIACFALKNYTHEDTNIRTLLQCNGAEDLLLQSAEIPDVEDDAYVIVERLQIARMTDESVEHQAHASLVQMVDEYASSPQVSERILEFVGEHDWSPRLVSASLDMFGRIIDETKSSSRPQLEKIYADGMHRDIVHYLRKNVSNEQICVAACNLLAKMVAKKSYQEDLVDVGCCEAIVQCMESCHQSGIVISSALQVLHPFSTNDECRSFIKEKYDVIVKIISEHPGNDAIQISGIELVSSL